MTQKIQVQDGNIIYAASDPTQQVNMEVDGKVTVAGNLVVGGNPDANGTISSPSSGNLTITTSVGGNVIIDPAGNIVLKDAVWPDGTVTPVPGMFLGVDALNALQYYAFALATVGSDTLTASDLNIAYPNAKIGQFVVGPTVVYLCVGASDWRILGPSSGSGSYNLIWTTAGNLRTLTGYTDPGNITQTVRSASFVGNLLQLTIASFTPILASAPTPSTSLNWDVAATGFGVTVNNPSDFLTEWVSNVASLTVNTGDISALNTFTAGAQSSVPGPAVDWTQGFTTNVSSYIRPISSTMAGGSANATVNYDYWDGSSEVPYSGTSTFNIQWATPTISLALTALSGDTFLQEYTSTPYTIGVTGITTSSNYVHSISATGGSVSDPLDSGTFTFTTPIHKDNVGDTRTVSDTTTFTRPIDVTGTSYVDILSDTTANPGATFTYPSLWVFTPSTFDVPVRGTYVLGSGFQSATTVLGNQVKIFADYVDNTNIVPLGFWFAVRSAASQPTSFKTGASPSLLSDVAYVTGAVNLEPDSPPVGYVTEPYNLYGITLQPGITYVSIS